VRRRNAELEGRLQKEAVKDGRSKKGSQEGEPALQDQLIKELSELKQARTPAFEKGPSLEGLREERNNL